MKAALTNLGMYNEGILNYTWIDLPIDEDDFQKALAEVKYCNDEQDFYDECGNPYEEYFFSDYENAPCELGEYESLERLNEIAEKIEEYGDIFLAILEAHGERYGLEEDPDNYYLVDADNDEDLGYYFAHEVGCIDIPDSLEPYFDYERYGRDISFDGIYTSYGFLMGA